MVLNPGAEKHLLQVASKEPIAEMFNLSSRGELQPNKLTWAHLECRDCHRQKVDLAVQVLSNSTATCLEHAGKEGLLKSKDYQVVLSSKFYLLKKYLYFVNILIAIENI